MTTTTHNTTHNTTQDTTRNTQGTPVIDMPSLYNAEGKIDITPRRNAVIARMKASNTGQEIWNYTMGDDN